MQHPLTILGAVLALAALAGCATPYALGRVALSRERYDEAAGLFREALARDPDRLDARAGLGIALFKLRTLGEAEEALRQVLARAPRHATARLYLGLTLLLRDDPARAAAELAALRDLGLHPRVAAQIERALGVIHSGPLSDEVRRFVTASLEDEMEWEREVHEAEQARPIYVDRRGFMYWPPDWALRRAPGP